MYIYNIFDQIHSGLCQRNVTMATSSTYVNSSCAVNQINFIHHFVFKYLTLQVATLVTMENTDQEKLKQIKQTKSNIMHPYVK